MGKFSIGTLLMVFFLCSSLPVSGQENTLKFNKDGTFKIVQFTDVHYKHGHPGSNIAIERIKEVLKAEKPDLVVFTGDVIYAPPADVAMRAVLKLVSDRKIPFVVTFGNHDDEQGMTRHQLYDIIRKVPGNIMPENPDRFDFVLPIKSSDGTKDAALLYCMDSNSYAQLDGIGGYGWFTTGQVYWYQAQSEMYKRQNNGTVLPALAFFHIPLPEYH